MNRLLTIEGVDVNVHEDGYVSWLADMMIDADGGPHAYHPKNTGLDALSSAGYPDSPYWKDILVTDGRGRPVIQGERDPAPGYFISRTAYEHREFLHTDPRRYVDAETVPYVVVPPQVRKGVRGVVLGCLAECINTRTGKSMKGPVADIGPRNKIGEASIAMARALGIGHSPRTGGTSERIVIYRIWPGIVAPGFQLQPA